MFSTLPKANINFYLIFILSSAKPFNLDQSKILSFVKELSSTTFWWANNPETIATRETNAINEAFLLELDFLKQKLDEKFIVF